ncbi:hypothetical protein NARC_40026 [Candidatus Nitrosocosmicus arcticus]|uniref:Uncharacterized protein n=1 Tax=Candidatus Nitrosocosmicus arcticus TaxID=2035267 RepID=A0A557SWT6_9ARCH|nr:hypothetical protein NARC_40026 [Candidatus Nitrosocosmicus arcticus]
MLILYIFIMIFDLIVYEVDYYPFDSSSDLYRFSWDLSPKHVAFK